MTDIGKRIEAFYAAEGPRRDELLALREILAASPLEETFKWRSPCYTFAGGNVATVWAFRDSSALSFFKGVLLTDPQGMLEAPDENSRSVRMARFADRAAITAARETLAAYLREAAANEEAGRRVTFTGDDLDYPEELADALAADPDLSAAFEGLTPGRRRGYILNISGAKQSATRAARVGKWAPRILQGKGMHDR